MGQAKANRVQEIYTFIRLLFLQCRLEWGDKDEDKRVSYVQVFRSNKTLKTRLNFRGVVLLWTIKVVSWFVRGNPLHNKCKGRGGSFRFVKV